MNGLDEFRKSLMELENSIKDLCLLLSLNNEHKNGEIKIYNPHCPNWKRCGGGSFNMDCFMCGNNVKGSEQYALEKLTRKVVESMVEK